jgi:hypothetical protein
MVKKFVILLLFAVISCKNNKKGYVKTYPDLIAKKGFQDLYDHTKWNYFSYLLDRKEDSLCLSKDVEGIAVDTTMFIVDTINRKVQYPKKEALLIRFFYVDKNKRRYYCNCQTAKNDKTPPDQYWFVENRLREVSFSGQFLIRVNKNQEWGQEIDTSKFYNIIRKYKDQLNPWLKEEAQQRGIIE